MELARLRLLDRVIRGSGTGFFSKKPSQDFKAKFLIFEVVFSTCTCTGMGNLDFEASFCLGCTTEVGMVHTEGKVLLYHHAPVRVSSYNTLTEICFVENIDESGKSDKISLNFVSNVLLNQ